MSDDTTPIPHLPDRASCLLECIEAEGGEWRTTFAAIAEACGLARSTAQLAVTDLLAAGLITRDPSPMGTVYRLTDQAYRPSLPGLPTDVGTCTDPHSSDAPAPAPEGAPVQAPAPACAPAQNPFPTPQEPSAATRTDGPSRAHAQEVGTPPVGTPDVGTPRPIGNLAVAAAMESAAAAGRTIDAGTRGRIGQAAQRLAGEHSVEALLAAARRVGAGGYADLGTALERGAEAVPDRTPAVRDRLPVPPSATLAALMPTGETLTLTPRMEKALRLVRGTWPRAVIDAELWQAELGKVREDILLDAIRSLAKDGDDFAPSWGKVYKRALEIGQPRVGAERNDRARQREAALRAERGW